MLNQGNQIANITLAERSHQLKKRGRKAHEGGKRVFVTPSLAETQQSILPSVCNAVSQPYSHARCEWSFK